MKFDIGAIFGQFVALYARLPLAQKIAIPLLIASSMATIVFVARWANHPDYQVLFSGLEDGDAGAVVERLKDKKIGFRLRDEGHTVEITPPGLVHELRLDLASAGLPKGGNVGFELFNESTLGRTGFVEKITYVRALQGELERTISSITAVRSVRVHITSPERSVFAKRDVLPTASVVLKLKAGEELTPQQIKGMANLIAGSVERLTPDNVTILDAKGTLLNEKRDTDAMNGVDLTRIEYQRKIGMNYAKQIETMLAEILGPGKAVARVTADVDFSQYEKEEEAYDPGGKVVRAERSTEEAGGLSAEGGVPGVVSNLTNTPELLTAPDNSKNKNLKKENLTNYEISRAISKTIAAVGKLQKLSVAVLVDGQYATVATGQVAADGKPIVEKHYKPLTAEMMRKIENLVKQTVGFDGTRGDTVSLENIEFIAPDTSLDEVLVKAEDQQKIFTLLSYALPALFILLFMLIVLRPLVRFLVSPTDAEVDLSRLLPAGIEELEAELEAERSRITSVPDVMTPGIDIEELQGLLAENSRVVKENPQQAALLIRYWINEGKV